MSREAWKDYGGVLTQDISVKQVQVEKNTYCNITSEIPKVTASKNGASSAKFARWTNPDALTLADVGVGEVIPRPDGIDPQWRNNDKIYMDRDKTLYAYYNYYGITTDNIIWDKPVIYLYPTEETEINVKLAYADRLTVSYPKYKEKGWNVLAEPDGTLTDLETNRKLYCLYYEAKNNMDPDIYKDGFIVKGEDSAEFLEEKLAILGLNEKESEEFIIYWLPKLEANKYNYIRFADEEYINKNMPLKINPEPDNLIRILMEYEGIEEPFEVKEQTLTTPSRQDYTVVEWGGTEICQIH